MDETPLEEPTPKRRRKVANTAVIEDAGSAPEITVEVDEPAPEEVVEETVMVSHGEDGEQTPATYRLKMPMKQPWLPR